MAKSKLLSALDAHKGRNYKLEHDKKLRKAAEKRKSAKRQKIAEQEEDKELDFSDTEVAVTSRVTGNEVGVLTEK